MALELHMEPMICLRLRISGGDMLLVKRPRVYLSRRCYATRPCRNLCRDLLSVAINAGESVTVLGSALCLFLMYGRIGEAGAQV